MRMLKRQEGDFPQLQYHQQAQADALSICLTESILFPLQCISSLYSLPLFFSRGLCLLIGM